MPAVPTWGKPCNRLHYDFITWPLLIKKAGDLRQSKPDEYDRRLRKAILDDMLARNYLRLSGH
ncbi:MAG: hypothetical protein Ct9H300mP25_01610 [Acidobacteriota bacterium]|nr:MAG: hypothetical protein Ct9H300mP25_01610 [Acidobacteriota bacterium]